MLLYVIYYIFYIFWFIKLFIGIRYLKINFLCGVSRHLCGGQRPLWEPVLPSRAWGWWAGLGWSALAASTFTH